jgi:plastocyanin
MRSFPLLISILVCMMISFSCKKDNHCEPKPVVPPTPVTEEIQLINTTFSPAEKTVAVGTTVRWVNKDPYAHTVTASDNAWDSGNLNSGQSFEHKFEAAGTYNYYCKYHLPGMTGKIIVQ